MLYIYAFISHPVDPDRLPRGLRQPLQILGTEPLYAVVEVNPFEEGLPQDEKPLLAAVLHHDRIVQEIFQQTAVLPLRFGSQFLDEAQLLNYLQEQGESAAQTLAALKNQAEFTLSCVPRSPSSLESSPESDSLSNSPDHSLDNPPTGRAYFLAKKQRILAENDRLQVQEQQWEELRQTIQRCYPQCVWAEPQENSATRRVHLFVSLKREVHLRKQVLQWQSTYSAWEIYVSDPLPPYHFLG